jgi:hypothetical protein
MQWLIKSIRLTYHNLASLDCGAGNLYWDRADLRIVLRVDQQVNPGINLLLLIYVRELLEFLVQHRLPLLISAVSKYKMPMEHKTPQKPVPYGDSCVNGAGRSSITTCQQILLALEHEPATLPIFSGLPIFVSIVMSVKTLVVMELLILTMTRQ